MRWWECLSIVPPGNKAWCLSSVNHSTAKMYHHIRLMWTLGNWLWIFIFAVWWRYWSHMLLSPWNQVRTNNQLVIFFECSIALVPSLPLLAGFVVQSLLAVSPCWFSKTEGEVLGNTAALGTSWGSYTKIWTEETTSVSWHYPYVVSIAPPPLPRCSFEHVPSSDNIHSRAAWLSGLKYLLTYGPALIGQAFGLSSSDISPWIWNTRLASGRV